MPCTDPSGTKRWFKGMKLHRTNGPAVIYPDGSQEWWINDQPLSKDLFLKLTQGPKINLPLYLGQGFDEFIAERLKT